MKLTHCKICGRELVKWERLYCKVCSKYMHRERVKVYDMKSYLERKKESKLESPDPIILEDDPSDDPLTVGMTIPVMEHEWMKKLKTYTPGTIIRQGETRKRIDLLNGKMVEVRI